MRRVVQSFEPVRCSRTRRLERFKTRDLERGQWKRRRHIAGESHRPAGRDAGESLTGRLRLRVAAVVRRAESGAFAAR